MPRARPKPKLSHVERKARRLAVVKAFLEMINADPDYKPTRPNNRHRREVAGRFGVSPSLVTEVTSFYRRTGQVDPWQRKSSRPVPWKR